jgi:hypothetical protein
MCNKQTNKMEVTKKLSVILKSPDNNKIEVIFDTDKYYLLDDLLEKNGFKDYKVMSWKLKRVIFIS